MNALLFIGSAFQFFGWIAPIVVLLALSYTLSVRLRTRTGSGQFFIGGAILSLTLLFDTWWFVKLGRFSEVLRIGTDLAMLIGIIIAFGGAFVLTMNAKLFFRGEFQQWKAQRYSLAFLGAAIVFTITYSTLKDGGSETVAELLLYNSGVGLLSGLYCYSGLALSQGTSFHRRVISLSAFLTPILISADPILRTYAFLNHLTPDNLIPLRFIAAIGMGLAALLYAVAAAIFFRSIYPTLLKELPESPLARYKQTIRKRFLLVFILSILLVGSVGIIILESLQTSQESVQRTYLAEQERLAQSVAANFESLTETLIGELRGLSQHRSVQEARKDSLRILFRTAFIKWSNIVTAFSRVDERGVLQYTFPENTKAIGQDISWQSHVKELLSKHDTTMSDLFTAVQGYPAIAIHVPVFRNRLINGQSAIETPVQSRGKVFAGSVALLLKPDAFSIRAFRNAGYFTPNPLAALDIHGHLLASSDTTAERASRRIGESGETFLKNVFGEEENQDSLRCAVRAILQVQKPTFVLIRRNALDFAPRFVVATPIHIAGKRWGSVALPVKKAELVSIYQSIFAHQFTLWGLLSLVILGLMGIVILIFHRWSQFLESEVTRELDIIHETEGKYENLFQNAVVGIYESTPAGRFVSVNPALAAMLGYGSVEELLNAYIPQDIYADPADREQFKRAIESNGVHGMEVPLKKKDGSIIYTRLHGRCVRDKDGNALSYQGFVEDITEQVFAKRLLEESEKRYRDLFETNPAGLYVSTFEGKILEANEALARIYGYESADEVKATPAVNFYRDASEREAFLDKLKTTGRINNLVWEQRRKDGGELFIMENAHLIHDPRTGKELITGAILDITELVHLQREAEVHHRFMEALNEILVAALEQTDLDTFFDRSLKVLGEHLDVSRVYIFKNEPGRLMRNTHEWVAPDVQPFLGLTASYESYPYWEQKLSANEPIIAASVLRDLPIELHEILSIQNIKAILVWPLFVGKHFWGFVGFDECRRERKWNDAEIQLFRAASQVISTVIERTMENQTRLKAEEEQRKLLLAFEQLTESVTITDKDGIIQYVNPAFTRITGYKAYEAIGKKSNITKSGEHPREFYQQLWETILSGKVFRARFRNQRKNGSLYYEDKVITPVMDGQGNITNFISSGRDVTQELMLEEQLIQAQKMESIGLLASGIAHDFNNLLGGILGYASFMKTKLSQSDPIYRYADTIERSATRAAELTSQLLAFARGGQYNVKPVNVNDIAEEALKLAKSSLDKSIVIETHFQSELPNVEGDAGQIQQVLMNLILNARDAMPAGGKLIVSTESLVLAEEYVKSHVEAKKGLYVLLSVSDTGIGMDKKTLQRIFEPFFTTKEKGTGLGLSMVYGIVKNHGGFIRVYSEVGEGTTFRVYLPASEKTETPLRMEEAPMSTGNELILVVDDEDTLRELVKDVLETYGYRVMLAGNGEEALQVYSKHKEEIALVILDMVMPKMGGRETFLKLKELNPKVRALLSTGYSQNGKAQEILNSGVMGFLQKPYQAEELAAKVRKVLDLKL
ncbi:MAG: PAS domain S-box protein [Bacteroidota bacterium]